MATERTVRVPVGDATMLASLALSDDSAGDEALTGPAVTVIHELVAPNDDI